jgi:hypothetical protein
VGMKKIKKRKKGGKIKYRLKKNNSKKGKKD